MPRAVQSERATALGHRDYDSTFDHGGDRTSHAITVENAAFVAEDQVAVHGRSFAPLQESPRTVHVNSLFKSPPPNSQTAEGKASRLRHKTSVVRGVEGNASLLTTMLQLYLPYCCAVMTNLTSDATHVATKPAVFAVCNFKVWEASG